MRRINLQVQVVNKSIHTHCLLLTDEQSSHSHTSTNTHTRNKDLCVILFRNVQARRNLSRTSYNIVVYQGKSSHRRELLTTTQWVPNGNRTTMHVYSILIQSQRFYAVQCLARE